MAFAAQDVLDDLTARAADWSVHGGRAYLASSDMGLMERPQRQDGRLFMSRHADTGHDLLDFAQFTDFMNARARQARALELDLATYASLAGEYPDFGRTTEGAALSEGFGERFVMAMYGTDEARHRGRFERYLYDRDERPYEFTRMNVAAMANEAGPESDGGSGILAARLKRFASDWERVRSAEAVAEVRGTRPTVLYFTGANDRPVTISSPEMACRYAAEVFGRGRFFDRTRLPHEYSGNESVGSLKAACPDETFAMMMSRISVMCRNERGTLGVRGTGDQAYALDGLSVFRAASLTDDESCFEFGPMPERHAVPARDMSDLDGAYAGLEHGGRGPLMNRDGELSF